MPSNSSFQLLLADYVFKILYKRCKVKYFEYRIILILNYIRKLPLFLKIHEVDKLHELKVLLI